MKAKLLFALIPGVMALAVAIAVFHSQTQPTNTEPQQPDTNLSSQPIDSPAQALLPETLPATRSIAPRLSESAVPPQPAEEPAEATNKLERLAQIRGTFRALAGG